MATTSNRYLYIFVLDFISLLTLIAYTNATSECRVATSAPVHPVKEGAILSLHCKISNLAPNHYVTISRQLDDDENPQILSWGNDILGSIDDSFFLAVRQLNDGSIIYFLSIVGVTIRDKGKYTCKVMPSTQDSVIAIDSTNINIQYFPKDPAPLCTPKEQSLVFYAGTPITLNCTSESAYPKISMEWSRTGAGSVPESVTQERNGVSYTELRLRASLADNEAVFLCQITSTSFPGKVKSCHVGPISVVPNPNENFVPTNHAGESSELPQIFYPPFPAVAGAHPTTALQLFTEKNTWDNHRPVTDCREVCSSFSSPKFFWIVATVVACVLSFIFFVMGAALVCKYRQAHAQQPNHYSTNAKPFPTSHPTREYIYTELDSNKRGVTNSENIGSCVYMSLERRENHDNQTDLPRVKATKE